MLEWLGKYLETFLGKTITGVIAVFILGAVTMYTLPRWLVTTDTFQKSVKSIYHEMNKGDKWRALETINVKKIFFEKQKKELEDEYEILQKQGTSLTIKQINRLKDVEDELKEIKQREKRLIMELQKPDTLFITQNP